MVDPIDQPPRESTTTDGDPVASVVIVSDFASGTEQGWNDIRRTLAGLAAQDFDEPVEYILIESEDLRVQVPPDLREILPSLRIEFVPSHNSYELRNDGVRLARCEIVGALDGDCVPDPDWMHLFITALRRNPSAAAVSGRTFYAGRGFFSRAATLLERGYIEEGAGGTTRHITNNGCGFRRSAYLEHPLRTDIGVFASALQSEAMRRAGYDLLFEPAMRVTHSFYPSFETDHRRGSGYGAIRIRLEDDRVPYSSLARLGYASVPIFFFGRLAKGCSHALRSWRDYGVRWYELPGVFALAVACCVMELPGLWRAVRGLPPPETRFR